MRSGIYEIVNRENGKRYIGSAIDCRKRYVMHRYRLNRGDHHSRHLQRAWHKYEATSFVFRQVVICATKDLLFYEQRALDTFKPEYNATWIAGKNHFGGRKHSLETLQKMSQAQRGNTATKGKKRSPSAVAKTAAAHTGMKRSDETRKRISAARIGKTMPPRSQAHKDAISAALRGRSTLSPEARARMAATKRGKTLSPEHRAKIGEASLVAWARRKAEAQKS